MKVKLDIKNDQLCNEESLTFDVPIIVQASSNVII